MNHPPQLPSRGPPMQMTGHQVPMIPGHQVPMIPGHDRIPGHPQMSRQHSVQSGSVPMNRQSMSNFPTQQQIMNQQQYPMQHHQSMYSMHQSMSNGPQPPIVRCATTTDVQCATIDVQPATVLPTTDSSSLNRGHQISSVA